MNLIDPMAEITALMMSVAQRKDRLAATGLSPVFNEQTPKVEPFDVTKADDAFYKLVADVGVFAYYNTHLELAGLAANQLQKDGKRLDLRLCYIMIDRLLTPVINPVIVSKFGPTWRNKEGCLTWPNKRVVAIRHLGVEVKYISFKQNVGEVTRRVEGTEAIIWQHEIDHMDGIPEEFVIQLAKEDTPGPNEKCICNSGKKFKKCCGRA